MYNVRSIYKVLSCISLGNLSLTFESGHSRVRPKWRSLRKSGNYMALNMGILPSPQPPDHLKVPMFHELEKYEKEGL